MSNPIGFGRGRGALSPGQEAAAREMYEAGEMTMAAIGASLGVSNSVIVGLAHRHWTQRAPRDEVPIPTLLDRMNTLDAMMAEVLRLYPPGTGMIPAPPPQKRPRARDWAHR